nr:aminoglycoside phosphotransferase family protein [Streptomyces sp. TS71-3]
MDGMDPMNGMDAAVNGCDDRTEGAEGAVTGRTVADDTVTGGTLADDTATGGTLHAGETPTDAGLVRRLIAAQFPEWAGLPVRRHPSSGTVNAVYRLGDHLSVRLPRLESGVPDAVKERTWLPRLAPLLPVAVPEAVGVGVPGEGYPWTWSVHRWLDGTHPHPDVLASPVGPAGAAGAADPVALARDLGRFVTALRRADATGAPPAYRGGPLAAVDAGTRAALKQLAGMTGLIDTAAATAAWEKALQAPPWTGPPRWAHADLMPGNLLVTGGRLCAVIDFGTLGAGDPACDLIPAWNLLPAPARPAFRDATTADDAQWERGRGWALSMALIQLPYYKDTNPAMAENARHVIREVLADEGAR